LRARLHDGNDAVDLQANTVPSSTLREARAFTGKPDLSARLLILRRCGGHRCRHSTNEQTEQTNLSSYLAHRPHSLMDGNVSVNRVDIVMSRPVGIP
jgi:hypothetical protein